MSPGSLAAVRLLDPGDTVAACTADVVTMPLGEDVALFTAVHAVRITTDSVASEIGRIGHVLRQAQDDTWAGVL